MAHLGFAKNEYGTLISRHKCDICREPFTVCPASDFDEPCGTPWCASYDPSRDVERGLREGYMTLVPPESGDEISDEDLS